jgi:hypothetical protein
MPQPPTGTAPAQKAAAGVFAAASTIRKGRSLHPRGIAFHATVEVAPDGGALATRRARSYEGAVRFSRGAGLPARLPDVNGLAVRIADAHGPQRHQDLLLVTSSAAPLARHVILPALSFTTRPFSSILAYRLDGGGLVVVGGRPADGLPAASLDQLPELARRGHLRYALMVASLRGGWEEVGEVVVGREPLPGDEGEALRFNPWHTGPSLRPAGPLNALRDPAYRASQRARLGS